MWACVLCGIVLPGSVHGGPPSGELPAALQALLADRLSIASGEIELTWSSSTWPQARHYTSRLSDAGDQLLVWHADEEGVLNRDAEGRPRVRTIMDIGPVYSLTHDGISWIVHDGSPTGDARRQSGPSAGVPDMRSLGLTAAIPWYAPDIVVPTTDAQGGRRKFTTEEAADVTIVRASSGDERTIWVIDRKTGMPISVKCEYQGKLLTEARMTVGEVGGRWFPRKIEYFRSDYKNGQAPADVITILSGRFDSPDLPHDITPADIGVDAGFNVTQYDESMQHLGLFRWDGQKIVSLDEFNARERRGEVTLGAQFLEKVARAQAMSGRLTTTAPLTWPAESTRVQRLAAPSSEWEGEWDRYVREFCEHYKLGNEQRQQAQRLLDECKSRATEYVRRKRQAFEAFDRLRANFVKLSSEEQNARRAALTAQRAFLLAPINAVFEERLKPALEKLPTRAQRQAAVDSKSERRPAPLPRR
ncbi:MAG TPA: hypothetical protein PKD53_30780 [Chloroflexaceae bacterium]|nr:hypothetical protein [Chloroflexaceae bacterium]